MSTRPLSAVIAAPAIWLIRGYQLVVSPMRPPTCRFYPSCSAYALTAIERFGVLRGSWLATRRLLLDQLRALLARFRSRPAAPLPQPYLGLSGPADDPRLIVRRTYQLMLDWARSMGHARFPYQTPSTFAAALTAALPESREPIAALTATYVRARYAVEPVPPDDARLAQASLVRLQTHNVLKSTLTDQA